MKVQFEQKVHDNIEMLYKYVPSGLVTFVAHLVAGKHDIKNIKKHESLY